MDLVLDAVEAGHQHRREGEVGVGAGIGEAQIRVYKKSDYTSGLITPPYIQGQSETKDDGRWANPVYLDSGITYTVVYNKAGVIETTTAEVAL